MGSSNSEANAVISLNVILERLKVLGLSSVGINASFDGKYSFVRNEIEISGGIKSSIFSSLSSIGVSFSNDS